MERGLKGYRIRVVVDLPIWTYDEETAIKNGKYVIEMAHSACKVMKVTCLLETEPDNRKIFPEAL